MTDRQIQFTEAFRKDVIRLCQSGQTGWLSKLERLREGGFRENDDIKSLKTQSKLLRWRLGDVRVL